MAHHSLSLPVPNPLTKEKSMTVKRFGPITLEQIENKFFWVRELTEKSQEFASQDEAVKALKTGRVSWKKMQ